MEERRRILLVDDDGEARELLLDFFVEEGYLVETAADGAAALAKLDLFGPDLVVTDYEMPGMSGVDLIRIVQARHPGQATLLVTAREDLQLPVDALGWGGGPVACLQKPVDLDDLGLVVHQLLEAAALYGGGYQGVAAP
jgi:DNA-binding response OmpR family regulator